LLDTNLKIILLDYQNNFVGTLKIMSNAAKHFNILTGSVLQYYFDRSQNYFFYLYSVKILNLSAKTVFFYVLTYRLLTLFFASSMILILFLSLDILIFTYIKNYFFLGS